MGANFVNFVKIGEFVKFSTSEKSYLESNIKLTIVRKRGCNFYTQVATFNLLKVMFFELSVYLNSVTNRSRNITITGDVNIGIHMRAADSTNYLFDFGDPSLSKVSPKEKMAF